jgi:hypothetical protein
MNLQSQVGGLGVEDLHELRRRLAAWWPTVPFNDLVTATGEQVSMANPAFAWLFLAPAAEMQVTDEQWAQLATNPVIHPEQGDWLRRQATAPRMQRAHDTHD